MPKPIDQFQAAHLWDSIGVTVENIRMAPRQHKGNVIFCGYADILVWIFADGNTIPLIHLCGNSIKIMGNDIHFDPKSERGKGDRKDHFFAHWFPLTGASRAVLTQKIAGIPEIQEMCARAMHQLTEGTPTAAAAGE